jgi:hypothetical protein
MMKIIKLDTACRPSLVDQSLYERGAESGLAHPASSIHSHPQSRTGGVLQEQTLSDCLKTRQIAGRQCHNVIKS